MRGLEVGLCCVSLALCVLAGCKASDEKTKPEPATAEPIGAAIAQMTDDELCAWMCANCFREYAGLLEYPGDCRGVCIAQISTKPCAEKLEAKVRCQVNQKDCGACDAEKQAALRCLRECAKIRKEQGEDALPEHCKNEAP